MYFLLFVILLITNQLIAILLYLFVNIMIAKQCGESMGEAEMFGSVHSIWRKWGEFVKMIGYAFIPSMVASILETWQQKRWRVVKIIARAIRTAIGAPAMLGVGGMAGIIILRVKDISMINGTIFMLLCMMMITYALLEYMVEGKRAEKTEKMLRELDEGLE